MSLLLETIRFQDGIPVRLDYHYQRMQKSRSELFALNDEIPLFSVLYCPGNLMKGRVKCRLTYEKAIHSVSFEPYIPRQIRSLQCVDAKGLQYAIKYEDRSAIEALKSGITRDEILLCREGFLMDTSYANIILLQDGKWYTPSTPLLKGTQRQYLLDTGFIIPRSIKINDLKEYSELRLINAMLDPFDLGPVPVDEIYV